MGVEQIMVLMSSGPERRKENCMLMINGKWQEESPVKASAGRKVETAALDMKSEKKPKRKPTHGVETRNRARN